jgi:DNA-binding HxlR family transcriptional regulator
MAGKVSSTSENRDEATARPSVPRPGGIYDPVARTLDAIGDRWSLVLVRHLLLGPRGFQDLRQRTGIAPRVLSSRLRELREGGFVEALATGGYQLTDRGLSLEPIVSSIARWFTRHGLEALQLDISQFTETSAQSVLESLPFLLREPDADTADVAFEIRLTGAGGGVWSVRIDNGQCHVEAGFAEHADVRYTADAKVWCAMALGLADARDLVKRGLVTKDGGPAAMDHYFHQISHPEPESVPAEGENTLSRENHR